LVIIKYLIIIISIKFATVITIVIKFYFIFMKITGFEMTSSVSAKFKLNFIYLQMFLKFNFINYLIFMEIIINFDTKKDFFKRIFGSNFVIIFKAVSKKTIIL